MGRVIQVQPAGARALGMVRRDRFGTHYTDEDGLEVTDLPPDPVRPVPAVTPAGALARYTAEQAKTDEGGRLRASLRLRIAVRGSSTGFGADDAAFDALVKTGLSGTELRVGKVGAVVAAGTSVKSAVSIGRELADIRKLVEPGASVAASSSTMASEVGSALSPGEATARLGAALAPGAPIPSAEEIVTFLVEQLGQAKEAVSGAIEAVLENTPLIGVVVNGLKAIGKSILLAMDIAEKLKYRGWIRASISVVQTEVFKAGEHYATLSAHMNGQEIARAMLKAVAAGTGVGSAVVGPVDALVGLGVKIMLLINEFILVRKTNDALRSGAIDRPLLRTNPQLALYTPFLPGMDPLSLLGVMPPGWSRPESATSSAVRRLTEVLRTPENADLLAELGQVAWDSEGATQRSAGRTWSMEVGAIRDLLEVSNKFLYDRDYTLFRGEVPVHEATAVTLVQRGKAKAKAIGAAALALLKSFGAWVWEKFKALGRLLRDLVARAGGPLPTSAPSAPTVTYSPVETLNPAGEWILMDFDDEEVAA